MKIILLFVFLLTKSLQGLNERIEEPCNYRFIIVVDGGSSGTRLHVFKFDKTGNQAKLLKASIIKSKIALSKFSNIRADWSTMDRMFRNFTTNALSIIPSACINDTPIYVQVTAGIRQIDETMSNRILNHIRSILIKTMFKFRGEYVNILSTSKEGLMAWISLNFVLNRLHTNCTNLVKTVGILDLGGGSTQIAFATNHPDLLAHSVQIKLFEKDYYVYTAGYDYMGINEIRIKYFNAENCLGSTCENKTVFSPCVHPNVRGHFHFGNRTLLIAGRVIDKDIRFCPCYNKGLELTRSVTLIRKFYDEMEFFGISAYYYILSSFNKFLTKTSEGYETNIQNIIIRALSVCKSPEEYIQIDRPFDHFLCLDMSYLVSLLHNRYGFEWYDKIKVGKKINDIGLSWALGYAISIL